MPRPSKVVTAGWPIGLPVDAAAAVADDDGDRWEHWSGMRVWR